MFRQVKIDGYFVDFGQVKVDGHFATFGQVKIDDHFDDFGQVEIFDKTPLGEVGTLGSLYFLLTGFPGIQFIDSTTLSRTQSVRKTLVTYPHCVALA